MNAQVQPTIEQTRFSLCQQLIGAGVTQPEAIVNAAKAIENFIYGTTGTQAENTQFVEQAKAETKKAVQEIEETSTVVQEAQTTEQPAIELADIKSALMSVAKADRNAFQAIMAQFNVTAVAQISVTDFPAVMTAVEKFEAEHA